MSRQNAVSLLGCVAFLSLCIGMGGCATPYQPAGFRGGYSEVRLADDAYLIQVSGNGFASQQLLWSYLQRRAQEVCVEHGYSSWQLQSPGSNSESFSTQDGYTISKTAPDRYTVQERGFRYNKHAVEAVAVCGNAKPRSTPGRRGRRAQSNEDGEDKPKDSEDIEYEPLKPAKLLTY